MLKDREAHRRYMMARRRKMGVRPRAEQLASISRINAEGLVHCPKCNRWLPRDAYYVDRSNRKSPVGVTSYCRDCLRDSGRYSEMKNFLRVLVFSTKSRCKKSDKEFLLPANWAEKQFEAQQGRCYYSGIAMTPSRRGARNSGVSWTAVSLDRVDNSKGYTPDNCVLCCWMANRAKGVNTTEALVTFCRAVVKHTDATIDQWREGIAECH